MSKWSEDVGMDILSLAPSQPSLRLVAGRLGEDGRVSEVNAGVQVQVGPGRDLVARQDQVLLAVARHLCSVRPQPLKIFLLNSHMRKLA